MEFISSIFHSKQSLPFYTSDITIHTLHHIIIDTPIPNPQENTIRNTTKNTPLSSVVVHYFPPHSIAIPIYL
jgi:hypothetical protein